MRKIKILVLLILLMGVTGCKINQTENESKQVKGIPDCVSSFESNGDYRLIIIVNEKEINDKEVLALELIEMVRNNEFKTIMFSYDVNGYPVGLQMDVYLTEEDWKDKEVDSYMKVSFKQENIVDGYNIVEHYNKFQLNIE